MGLVAGEFLSIFGFTALMRRLGIEEFGPGLESSNLAGGALLCGIGFTVLLFIVDLAITDEAAENQARVGVLAASLIAFLLAALVFRVDRNRHTSRVVGARLLRPVDPARDHIFGPVDAPLTIVEYGDFQCSFCSRASGSIHEVRRELGDQLRYV